MFERRNIKYIYLKLSRKIKDFLLSHGIGLENIRKRLRLLFGQDYTLSINERDDIFNVLLIIPLL